MITKYSLRALLLASLCMLPRVALAADAGNDDTYQNEVTLGGQWQNDSAAKYGKYNGSPDAGFSMAGSSFHLDQGSPYNSATGLYFKATGANLGFTDGRFMPDSSATLNLGQQGFWGVDLWQSDSTYVQSQKFNTLYKSDGTLLHGTPYVAGVGGINMGTGQPVGNLAPGQNIGVGTSGIRQQPGDNGSTNLAISNLVKSYLGQQTVGTERTTVGGDIKYTPRLNTDWTFTTSAQNEHKEGTKENSLVVGGTSLNKATDSMTYFAEPVNYDTGIYKAMASYNKQRIQAQFSYTFSNFVDNNQSFNAMSPFKLTSNSVPGTSSVVTNFKSSVYSLPPSNTAHQFGAVLGYNITPTARLVTNVAYGLQFQNASFVPETMLTTGPVYPTGMNGSNFDGKVQTFLGNMTLTARPLPKMDFKASYTINQRNNDSPQMTINSIDTDQFGANPQGGKQNPIITTLPLSYKNNTSEVEVGYHVTPSTKVIVGDSYNIKQENYTSVTHSDENTVSGQVRTQFTSQVAGSLRDAFSSRKAANPYNGNAPWLVLGETQATQVDNLGMQGFNEANRRRNEVRGDLSYSPREDLSMDLNGKYYADTYPQSTYGITKDHIVSVNPDVGYSVTEDISTHLFYSYEQAYYHLNDVVTQSGTTAVAPFSGTPFYWNRSDTSIAHTVGTNAEWRYSEKLKFNMGYTLQLGTLGFGMDGSGQCALNTCGGASAPWNYSIVQLPDSHSYLHSASLSGEYKLKENISLSMGYGVERYISHDYLNTQDASSPVYANFTLPGDGNPSYFVQTVGIGLHVKW